MQFYANLKPEPYVDLRTQLSNNREYRFAQSLTLTYRSTNDRLVQWAKGCMSEYLLQEAIEERERLIIWMDSNGQYIAHDHDAEAQRDGKIVKPALE